MSLVPVDKPSDSQFQCPHVTHSRDEFDLTFAQVQSSASTCRICRLHKDIILAVIDGHLPGLFEGPEDEAAREVILKSLVLQARTPYTCGNTYEPAFNIRDRNLWLEIFLEHPPGRRVYRRVGDRFSAIQGHEVHTKFQVGRYTSSERAFEKARQWMNECLSTHECANISTAKLHPPPTRLVDVECFSKDPARPPDTVRLFETQKVEYSYVCLSHRWGAPEHRQLKTTVRNIRDHMSGISWDDLPTTFQDAVTICRRLNVRYIWIDSLCILQEFDGITPDEAETTRQDFAHENAAMARTYRNSYFTISADISTNMDSGIFSKVPIDCGTITVPDDDGNNLTLYFRSNMRQITRLREKRTDLERRGWTFQESIIPSRVLHFGPFELEWRCSKRHTCECNHLEVDDCRDLMWDRRQFLAHIAARVPENEEDRARDWWEDVMREYSDRHLTNVSDKLPALSGMAQLYHQACQDTYLAGLWKRSLVYSLCWYHTVTYEEAARGSNYNSLGRRPAQYRAPSWSWASLDSDWSCYVWGGKGREFVHPNPTVGPLRPVCTIFEALCEPKTADPTGEVRFGLLDMEAKLISAKIGPPLWDRSSKYVAAWTIVNIDTDMSVCFFKPDCELVDDDLSIGGQIYCTPVLESVTGTGLERGCLVLKKLYTNLYRRIGFCVLEGGQPWVCLMSSMPKEIADASSIFEAQDYAFDDKTRIIII